MQPFLTCKFIRFVFIRGNLNIESILLDSNNYQSQVWKDCVSRLLFMQINAFLNESEKI